MINPTKKVVINATYGGFGLSAKAIARWAELQNRPCYFFVEPDFSGPYVSIQLKDISPGMTLFYAFDIPNPNEVLVDIKDWALMDSEEQDLANKIYNDHVFSPRELKRDDPLLVQIVEELGKSANSRFASLKIVEIPSDVNWKIDEYDGWETIHEVHRTWG